MLIGFKVKSAKISLSSSCPAGGALNKWISTDRGLAVRLLLDQIETQPVRGFWKCRVGLADHQNTESGIFFGASFNVHVPVEFQTMQEIEAEAIRRAVVLAKEISEYPSE